MSLIDRFASSWGYISRYANEDNTDFLYGALEPSPGEPAEPQSTQPQVPIAKDTKGPELQKSLFDEPPKSPPTPQRPKTRPAAATTKTPAESPAQILTVTMPSGQKIMDFDGDGEVPKNTKAVLGPKTSKDDALLRVNSLGFMHFEENKRPPNEEELEVLTDAATFGVQYLTNKALDMGFVPKVPEKQQDRKASLPTPKPALQKEAIPSRDVQPQSSRKNEVKFYDPEQPLGPDLENYIKSEFKWSAPIQAAIDGVEQFPETSLSDFLAEVRLFHRSLSGFEKTPRGRQEIAEYRKIYDLDRDSVQELQEGLQKYLKQKGYEGLAGQTDAPSPAVSQQKPFYHGAASDISKLGEDYYQDQNIYGQGFYTTDDAAVAGSYRKKNKKAVLKDGGQPNEITYQANEKQPVNFYDLDQPLDPALKSHIDRTAQWSESVGAAIEEAENNPGMTLAGFMDSVRSNSSSLGESRDSIQDVFENIREYLQRDGYGGFTHQGGRLTGGKPHQVKIYWDAPNQLDLQPAETKPQAQQGKKTKAHEMSREEWVAAGNNESKYDKEIHDAYYDGEISKKEVDRLVRRNGSGDKKVWAKTRKEIADEGGQSLKEAKAHRSEVNKRKGSKHYGQWRVDADKNKARDNINAISEYNRQLLEVHKGLVEEALAEGKPVPPEVLEDYPDLKAKFANAPNQLDLQPAETKPQASGQEPNEFLVKDPTGRAPVDQNELARLESGSETGPEGPGDRFESIISRVPENLRDVLRSQGPEKILAEARNSIVAGTSFRSDMDKALRGETPGPGDNITVWERFVGASLMMDMLKNASPVEFPLYRGERSNTSGVDNANVSVGDVIQLGGKPVSTGLTPNKSVAKNFSGGVIYVIEPGVIAERILPDSDPKQRIASEDEFYTSGNFEVTKVRKKLVNSPGSRKQREVTLVNLRQVSTAFDGQENPGRPAGANILGPAENTGRQLPESVLKDDDGSPLLLYHGTRKPFNEVDESKFGERDSGFYGRGFYASESSTAAEMYSGLWESNNTGASIVPVYFDLKNPLVTTRPDLYARYPGLSGRELTSAMQADGYDGVIGISSEGRLKEYVAFKPESIILALQTSDASGRNDRDIEVKPQTKSEAEPDGNQYFEKKSLESVGGYKSRDTLIYLSPEEFLALSEDLPTAVPFKESNLKESLDKGELIRELPFLQFQHDGKGNAKVVGHEGRHRALALMKEKGVTKIPVRLISEGNNAIRWGEQEEGDFDRLEVEWPSTLAGQDGRHTIPFPVSDLRTPAKATRPSSPTVPTKPETQNEPRPYVGPINDELLGFMDETPGDNTDQEPNEFLARNEKGEAPVDQNELALLSDLSGPETTEETPDPPTSTRLSPSTRPANKIVSGLQSDPSAISHYIKTERGIGVSAQPRKLSENVLGKIALKANRGGTVFIDSGVASTVAKGETVNFDRVFESYRNILERVDPSHRNMVMFVAPDYLGRIELGDGKFQFMGDQEKTYALQERYAPQIKELQEAGATVIIPVQRGKQALPEAFADVTDIIDFSNKRTAIGIPYNKGKWDDESILDLVRTTQGSEIPIHLLGGGVERQDQLTAKIHAIDPDIKVTGDAATEARNGKWRQSAQRPRKAPKAEESLPLFSDKPIRTTPAVSDLPAGNEPGQTPPAESDLLIKDETGQTPTDTNALINLAFEQHWNAVPEIPRKAFETFVVKPLESYLEQLKSGQATPIEGEKPWELAERRWIARAKADGIRFPASIANHHPKYKALKAELEKASRRRQRPGG